MLKSTLFYPQKTRKSQIKKGKVFEYGSGGSTLFWLAKDFSCVSIEHNPAWYSRIKNTLPTSPQIEYRLVEPEFIGYTRYQNPADPREYSSADVKFRGFSFKNYVLQISDFPQDYFDIILIDGRARPSCICHSVDKVKKGGVLIIDNSDREYYFQMAAPYLLNFDRVDFIGVAPKSYAITITSFFIKNKTIDRGSKDLLINS